MADLNCRAPYTPRLLRSTLLLTNPNHQSHGSGGCAAAEVG
jgi:hypothetical protein